MNQYIKVKDLREIVIDYISGPKLYWKFRNYAILQKINEVVRKTDNKDSYLSRTDIGFAGPYFTDFFGADGPFEDDYKNHLPFIRYNREVYEFMPLWLNDIFMKITSPFEGNGNFVYYTYDQSESEKSKLITLISDYYGLLNDFVDYTQLSFVKRK